MARRWQGRRSVDELIILDELKLCMAAEIYPFTKCVSISVESDQLFVTSILLDIRDKHTHNKQIISDIL